MPEVSGFGQVVAFLEQGGLFSFVLPFLLIFALLYVLLMQSGVVRESKKAAIIIAAAISLYSMVFPPFAIFVQTYSAILSVVLLILLFIMMIIGWIWRWGEETGVGDLAATIRYYARWITAFVIIIALFLLAQSGGLAILFPAMEAAGVGGDIGTGIIIAAVLLFGIYLFIRWLMGGGVEEEVVNIDDELRRLRHRYKIEIVKKTPNPEVLRTINDKIKYLEDRKIALSGRKRLT